MTEEIKGTKETNETAGQTPAAEENVAKGRDSLKHRELIKSLVISFVALFLLAGATYAWFSDEALTKGSSISAGFMGAELLIDEDLLQKYMEENKPDDFTGTLDEYATDVLKLTKYERKLEGTEASETYYDITNKDLKVITLKSVEPGQVYPVTFYVANIGELAFTYSAGFNVAEGDSLTGTQRLTKEAGEGKYGDVEAEAYKNNSDYQMKLKVIFSEQWIPDPDPEAGEGAYIDNGGHLEDVLKVYIGKDRSDIKDENYVGTIKDIMNKAEGEEASPSDAAYTGYLLPKSVVTNSGGKIEPQNLTIVYPADETHPEKTIEITGASELGKLNFLIVAPDNMDNRYQYASISLSLGAYATQVEYEEDGTQSIIYDRAAHGPNFTPVIPSETEEGSEG